MLNTVERRDFLRHRQPKNGFCVQRPRPARLAGARKLRLGFGGRLFLSSARTASRWWWASRAAWPGCFDWRAHVQSSPCHYGPRNSYAVVPRNRNLATRSRENRTKIIHRGAIAPANSVAGLEFSRLLADHSPPWKTPQALARCGLPGSKIDWYGNLPSTRS
jgi:hypothetical protein